MKSNVGPDSTSAASEFFWLANTRPDSTYYFSTEDGRLRASLEASINGGRTWRPITHSLGSSCGNSYAYARLGPEQAWPIHVPQFVGITPALLRLAVRVSASAPGNSEPTPGRGETSEDNVFSPMARSGSQTFEDEAQMTPNTARTLYSPAYPGSVNPGQFWRKPQYSEGIGSPWW